MDIRLRHAGAEHAVRLVPEGSGFTATVDGETHRIAWVASERGTATGGATVDEHAIELDGRIVRAVVARTRDRLLVALGGRVYTFETGEETRQAAGGAGLHRLDGGVGCVPRAHDDDGDVGTARTQHAEDAGVVAGAEDDEASPCVFHRRDRIAGR